MNREVLKDLLEIEMTSKEKRMAIVLLKTRNYRIKKKKLKELSLSWGFDPKTLEKLSVSESLE